jgi:hypothetical protein
VRLPIGPWELYFGPPRGGRVHDFERLVEWVLGRLEGLPERLSSATQSAERTTLREVTERLKRVLAGGAP